MIGCYGQRLFLNNTRRTNAMTEDDATLLKQRFTKKFGQIPRLYRAPGRVNLIGEHTDYNDGFVMPAAIGLYARVAIAPRIDRQLIVHSRDFSETIQLKLDHLPDSGRGRWSDYVAGVTKKLTESGHKLRGANLWLEGDVPQGAGLSSSASVEVAAGYALLAVSNGTIDRQELALLCQKAENEFVGARCGIMDQFVSCHGKSGCALLLDCRSLEFRLLQLPKDVRIVICNTMVKHSVAGGEYNQRRAECEEGVAILAKHRPGVRALRDVTLAELAAYERELPATVARRCRHVVHENARVLEAAAALDHGDLEAFGALMKESHKSLRDDFEVSCPELDLMVEVAESLDGVFGCRMTGGGFGGCTVNLVQEDRVDSFKRKMSEAYQHSTGRKPEIYACTAADGAGAIVSA